MSKRKETKKLAVILGQVLRDIRGGDARFADGNTSQKDVADALGYHQNYISLAERGVNIFPLHRLLDVCRAYGCKPEELVSRFCKAVRSVKK